MHGAPEKSEGSREKYYGYDRVFFSLRQCGALIGRGPLQVLVKDEEFRELGESLESLKGRSDLKAGLEGVLVPMRTICRKSS